MYLGFRALTNWAVLHGALSPLCGILLRAATGIGASKTAIRSVLVLGNERANANQGYICGKNPRREKISCGDKNQYRADCQSLLVSVFLTESFLVFSSVALSSFFMMEKMKTAEMTQRAMRIDHSTQRGRPPQSIPMMDTM